MVIPKPGDQCGCACGQIGSVSEIRRRAIEAGANKNFARSTVFVPYAGTSFGLNWYLENQTKATRGASCVTTNTLCCTSPGLIVPMSSHRRAGLGLGLGLGYRGQYRLQTQQSCL